MSRLFSIDYEAARAACAQLRAYESPGRELERERFWRLCLCFCDLESVTKKKISKALHVVARRSPAAYAAYVCALVRQYPEAKPIFEEFGDCAMSVARWADARPLPTNKLRIITGGAA